MPFIHHEVGRDDVDTHGQDFNDKSGNRITTAFNGGQHNAGNGKGKHGR